MIEAVQVEKGDLICVNVVTNTVWLEKKTDLRSDSAVPILEQVDCKNGSTKPYFPTQNIFKGTKDSSSWNVAYTLAYAVAWVCGLRVGEDTQRFRGTKDTYVFVAM
jgi:hypothetical protein